MGARPRPLKFVGGQLFIRDHEVNHHHRRRSTISNLSSKDGRQLVKIIAYEIDGMFKEKKYDESNADVLNTVIENCKVKRTFEGHLEAMLSSCGEKDLGKADSASTC